MPKDSANTFQQRRWEQAAAAHADNLKRIQEYTERLEESSPFPEIREVKQRMYTRIIDSYKKVEC